MDAFDYLRSAGECGACAPPQESTVWLAFCTISPSFSEQNYDSVH
jgi:hypothetical protein